jgi:lipoprotein-anchoring transpeptidase ErfK/SrfK
MLRNVLFGLLALGVGLFLGVFVLPYHFSGQSPINPTRLTGEYDPNQIAGVFLGKSVYSSQIPKNIWDRNIFGATTGEKRIEVDLTNQRLYAFEGGRKIFDFPVSSGLWGRTPTGEFRIWVKLRYVRMEGGNQAWGTYYNLPNVPFTMFFFNDAIPKYRGYGIHGTYWHNNFGHPMSHGCINLQTENAEKLYYWADPALNGKPSINATDTNMGTRIIIYGQAPAN